LFPEIAGSRGQKRVQGRRWAKAYLFLRQHRGAIIVCGEHIGNSWVAYHGKKGFVRVSVVSDVRE